MFLVTFFYTQVQIRAIRLFLTSGFDRDQSLRPVQSKEDEEKKNTEGEIELRKNRLSGSK